VHSYEEVETYEAQVRAEQIRGVQVNYKAARKTLTAELIQRYIDEECIDHKARTLRSAP
jgi:hypothetical protein